MVITCNQGHTSVPPSDILPPFKCPVCGGDIIQIDFGFDLPQTTTTVIHPKNEFCRAVLYALDFFGIRLWKNKWLTRKDTLESSSVVSCIISNLMVEHEEIFTIEGRKL